MHFVIPASILYFLLFWCWRLNLKVYISNCFFFFLFLNGSLVWFVIQASFKLLHLSQFNYYLLVYDSSSWRPQMSHCKIVIMWYFFKSLNSRDKRGIMTLFYIITYLNDLFKVCTFSLSQLLFKKSSCFFSCPSAQDRGLSLSFLLITFFLKFFIILSVFPLKWKLRAIH